MTDFQTGIITLMKCAVTGEAEQLPVGFSLEAAEEFAAKQNITTLIYEGAIKCGISPDEPAMQRMFQRYVHLLLHSERQLQAVERICKAFDENGIDYLPLKGCNMKKLYPKPELRYMGDADILIRMGQYDQIRPVMESLGFKEGQVYYHEYHWRKADIHIELHKSLIPSTSRSLYEYWGTGWNKTKDKGLTDSRYELSCEDDFLFLLTHFAKHYMGPGIGCRYLLDLWVYLRAYRELDTVYLEQELAKLQLLEFYRHIQTLIAVWFEGKTANRRSDYMTDYIFSGSSWGVWENGQVATAAKYGRYGFLKKLMLLTEKALPPLSKMRLRYPVLEKAAFLLPICWILRFFRVIHMGSQKKNREMYVITNVSDDSIAQYKDSMQYVGLYFEEG